MAYDKQKVYQSAEDAILKNNLITIKEVVAFIAPATSTFYELFPADSEEMEALKRLLEINKIQEKVKLRNRFMESDTPALALAAFKLLCDDDERKALSMSQTEVVVNQIPKILIPGEPTDN